MTRGQKPHKLAQAYINRVKAARGSAISAEESHKLLEWYIGLHRLNLLSNLIEGWTLLADQNAGTGTKVLGMNAYDGLLYNEPTWSVDGISFVRTSNQFFMGDIPHQNSSINGELTLISVSQQEVLPPGYPSTLQLVQGGGTSPGFILISGSNAYRGSCFTADTDGAGNFIGSDINFAAASFRASTKETFFTLNGLDTAQVTSGSFSWNSSSIRMAYAVGGSYMTGKISLSLVFNKVLSPTEIQAVRYLYKSTIGKGLGLP